jgi:Phage tail lysozyme
LFHVIGNLGISKYSLHPVLLRRKFQRFLEVAVTSNFERSEKKIASALHDHHPQGAMQELHNMQRSESQKAFKRDLSRLNSDPHIQSLLPGLQITGNDKTHKIAFKPTAGSSPEAEADSRTRPPNVHHQGSGDGGHHHGRKRHHGRRRSTNGDQDAQHPDQEQSADRNQDRRNPDARKRDQSSPDSDRTRPARETPDGQKDSQNLTKEDKEKYLMKRLTDPDGLHLSKAQAAGVIGNLEHESHLRQQYSSHKNADGKTEHNLGIAQWVGQRKHALEKFAGGDAQNFYKQVDFMEHELKTTERGALNALRRTTDATHAALTFSKRYERPGSPQNGSRVNYARLAYEKYGQGYNT